MMAEVDPTLGRQGAEGLGRLFGRLFGLLFGRAELRSHLHSYLGFASLWWALVPRETLSRAEPTPRLDATAIQGICGAAETHGTHATCCTQRRWQKVVENGVLVALQRRGNTACKRLDRRGARSCNARNASRSARQRDVPPTKWSISSVRCAAIARLASHISLWMPRWPFRSCASASTRVLRTASRVSHKVGHLGRHSTRLKLAKKAPARAAFPATFCAEKRLCRPVADDDGWPCRQCHQRRERKLKVRDLVLRGE